MQRHLVAIKQGDHTEDHAAAIAFGAMVLIHNEEMIRRGVLPAYLNDLPDYEQVCSENDPLCSNL